MAARVSRWAAAAVTAALLAAPALAYDDEVDYTAPYLTVENGQLVMKYPDPTRDPNHPATKPADAVDPPPAASRPATPASGVADGRAAPRPVALAGAVAGVALIVGAIVYRGRRRSGLRSSASSESVGEH